MQSNVKRNKQQSTVQRKKYPQITIYVSAEEKALIEKAADKHRDSTSNYIAKIVLPQAQKDAQ